jgi:GntR family transcriptional regulator
MLADGAPLQLQETTWPEDVLSGAALDDLHDALRSAGRQPAEATEQIATRQATPEEATALQVPVGAPVLEVRRVTYDETGRPLEVLVAVSSDRVRYLIERTPVAPED